MNELRNFLSFESINSCEGILKDFFDCIKRQNDQMLFSPKYYSDLLLVISDVSRCYNIPDMESIGYNLCRGIKEELETIGIYKGKVDMIGGLGEKAYAVNLYCKNTGNLKDFSQTLNHFLLDVFYSHANDLLSSTILTESYHYDLISGIAGALYYILDFDLNINDMKKVKTMLNYLVSLSTYYDYKGMRLPRFHIPKESIPTEENKIKYADGYLNFGLSHGMLGPLIALCKAKYKGYIVNNIDDAINTLFFIYETFKQTEKNEIHNWPNFISSKDFNLQNKGVRGSMRESWCYGNIGIMRGLYVAARYLGDLKLQERYLSYLVSTLNRSTIAYQLSESCLCHGYSSVLAISSYAFYDTQDKRLMGMINETLRACLDSLREDESLESNFFLLSGISGIVLTLVNLLFTNIDYGDLLMIK